MSIKNVDNLCVECGEDTSFGSGRFVNRIPADRDLDEDSPFKNLIKEGYSQVDGYLCPECTSEECDRCKNLIALDEQIGQGCFEFQTGQGFYDDSWMVCWDCLTVEEKNLLERNEN
jgi:hypothetical protein